jgi:regulator of protease activity HflC (stomatin/prohibitin superfamily)
VRYALDGGRVADVARRLPADVGKDLIESVVDGVLHRALSKHTVREVFTEKRVEIQDDVEQELRGLLARDGVIVRSLYLGHVDLPAQYRAGLEGLLAEELATEKMQYTLKLKEKKVQETGLEGDAAKLQREKAAEAAASEEIIAAKAREEAMKHVLPLKEKEIEQRRLEAEARKVQRMKDAEGDAEARRIESQAEADARRKLSDADAYRIEVTGKANTEQLARDSALIAKNPLLIQKTLADKLSDKIQVIVAPPSAGGFFAGGLLGMQASAGRGKPAGGSAASSATPAAVAEVE